MCDVFVKGIINLKVEKLYLKSDTWYPKTLSSNEWDHHIHHTSIDFIQIIQAKLPWISIIWSINITMQNPIYNTASWNGKQLSYKAYSDNIYLIREHHPSYTILQVKHAVYYVSTCNLTFSLLDCIHCIVNNTLYCQQKAYLLARKLFAPIYNVEVVSCVCCQP